MSIRPNFTVILEPCKTALVDVPSYNAKTREIETIKKRKYVCPQCNSIDLQIRRGHRDFANCECKACTHKWWTTFRPDVKLEQRVKTKEDYDMTAQYEEQIPF